MRHPAVRALRSTPGHERTLVSLGAEGRKGVLERLSLVDLDSDERQSLIARAKALAGVLSPHLPRIIEACADDDALDFVSTYVVGEWWNELKASEAKQGSHFLALAVELRILLDVLASLSANHSYRGPGAPLVHGAVGPCNILVGIDGHTRLVGALRRPGAARGAALGYAAPEILLGDGTADARADVYSVSAMLWEVLGGKPLFEGLSSDKVLARQLAGALPRPAVRESWAEPLVDIAMRGLAVDPTQRFAAVTDIAMSVRMIAQARLAVPTRVGRTVESLAEDAISRRERGSGAPSAAGNERPDAPVPSPLMPHERAAIADSQETNDTGEHRIDRHVLATPAMAFAPPGAARRTLPDASEILGDDDLVDSPPSIPPPLPSKPVRAVSAATHPESSPGAPPVIATRVAANRASATHASANAELPAPFTSPSSLGAIGRSPIPEPSESELDSSHPIRMITGVTHALDDDYEPQDERSSDPRLADTPPMVGPGPTTKEERRRRAAVIFVVAACALFGMSAWLILRTQEHGDLHSSPAPAQTAPAQTGASAAALPSPNATTLQAHDPSGAPVTSAHAKVPQLSDRAATSGGESLSSQPSGADNADKAEEKARKDRRTKKPRPSTYQPEGI